MLRQAGHLQQLLDGGIVRRESHEVDATLLELLEGGQQQADAHRRQEGRVLQIDDHLAALRTEGSGLGGEACFNLRHRRGVEAAFKFQGMGGHIDCLRRRLLTFSAAVRSGAQVT